MNVLLSDLILVFYRPRFPENIGMAARACANMGCPDLIIVEPERWDFLKAEPTATNKGMAVLEKMQIYSNLAEALAPFNQVIGTTARAGGWRRNLLHPEAVANNLAKKESGYKAAFLFGPEDRGLTNAEICMCDALVHIPVEPNAASLNLAQAALIMLYEMRKACLSMRKPGSKRRSLTHAELVLLETNFKQTLLGLDCLPGKNPAYAFLIWQDILKRADLSRPEYDALMGFCRQIRNKKG